MLRQLKLGALHCAHAAGISTSILNSHWRERRLLILCYHGVSMDDEHEWNPRLFMPPSLLRTRFESLVSHDCAVLPLDEAVQRLERGDLPPRSVAITFDDGTVDFHHVAMPVLREFGFPATLYYSTYYAQYNRPVFDVMASYLLWRGRSRKFRLPGIFEGDIDLRQTDSFAVALQLREFANRTGMTAVEKDALLVNLATQLEVDYDTICRKRLLHLMTPAEAREVAARGDVSIELHTHRHRVLPDRTLFEREIIQNRQYIAAITGTPTRHFCYPSGAYLENCPEWLRDLGIRSATTCEVDLAGPDSNPYLLPRFIDTTLTTPAEFNGWVTGIGAFLRGKRRSLPADRLSECATEHLSATSQHPHVRRHAA